MRKAIFCITIFILSLTISWGRPLNAIRKDAFTVGIKAANPPFGKSNTADKGLEYDLAAEISKYIGAPRFRVVVLQSMSEGEDLLEKKKIDAIISTVKPDDNIRARFLVSSPYYQTSLAIATLASSKSVYSLTDLNGKYVAYTPETKAATMVEKFIPKAKAEVVPAIEGGIELLLKGDVEGVLHDRSVLAWFASRNKSIKLLPNSLSEDTYNILIDKQSTQLLTEVNTALQAMLAASPGTSSPLGSLCAKYGVPMTLREIPTSAPAASAPAAPPTTAYAPAAPCPAQTSRAAEERLNNALKMVDALKSELEALRKELK